MKLSKKQIDTDFINNILPSVKERYEADGIKDKPARCESYNDYIDYLLKCDFITESKLNVYSIPKHLIS